jgi:hypothetical protein
MQACRQACEQAATQAATHGCMQASTNAWVPECKPALKTRAERAEERLDPRLLCLRPPIQRRRQYLPVVQCVAFKFSLCKHQPTHTLTHSLTHCGRSAESTKVSNDSELVAEADAFVTHSRSSASFVYFDPVPCNWADMTKD